MQTLQNNPFDSSLRRQRHMPPLVLVEVLISVVVLLVGSVIFLLPPLRSHAAPLSSNIPDTTSNIHIGLPATTNIASGQSLLSANPPVDEVWNWNGGGSGSSYPTIYKGMYFPVDRQPDYNYNAGAQQLSWFLSNHPDWIEYQCDKSTIAYEFGWSQDIPLDTSNPAVLSWLEQTFYAPAAQSGNYQHLDFDNFQFSNAGSWSGQRCGHWTGAQGSSTWVQQYNGTSNDPNYRANEIAMAQNLQSWLHAKYPNVKFAANFSYDNNYPSDSDSLMSHVDLLFDEQGFTNGNNGPPFYYADSAWVAKAQHTWNFINSGHAWEDVNQFGTSFSTLTTAQKQWAIANYLLLKNNESWIYMCGPQEYGTLLMAPEYTAQIGSPTNTYYASQNVYMRDFTNGMAIVNPSSTQSVTITLPANAYKDLSGNTVGTSVQLPAVSGLVLLNSNGPVSPTTTPTTTNSTPTPTSTSLPTVTPTTSAPAIPSPSATATEQGNNPPVPPTTVVPIPSPSATATEQGNNPSVPPTTVIPIPSPSATAPEQGSNPPVPPIIIVPTPSPSATPTHHVTHHRVRCHRRHSRRHC